MTVQSEQQRGSGRVVAAGAVVAAALVLVVALLAAGGAPAPLPEGLAGPGTATSWAEPVLRLVADLAAIACVGAVLVAAQVLPSKGEQLGAQGVRACQDAAVAAGVWAVASLCQLVVTGSVILGVPLSQLSARASDAAAITQVKMLVVSVVLITIVAVMLSGCRTVPNAQLALLISGCALAGPLLTGHGAIGHDTSWNTLATLSLVVHVFAATAWVGGLGALLRYGREGKPAESVARFSELALIAAGSLGVTGLLTAEIHLGERETGWGLLTQWVTTGYGGLVFAKAAAFAVLVGIGWWHRRSTLPALEAGRTAVFWRLAAVEVVLMAATIGLAVALSRTP